MSHDPRTPPEMCPNCGGDAGDNAFDRSICPSPCDSMHTRCVNCGHALDGCPFEDPPEVDVPADRVPDVSRVPAPDAEFAPRLLRVECVEFASCRWHGKRHVSQLGVQPAPCPKCGKEVVA